MIVRGGKGNNLLRTKRGWLAQEAGVGFILVSMVDVGICREAFLSPFSISPLFPLKHDVTFLSF